jgi:hypothetical protein
MRPNETAERRTASAKNADQQQDDENQNDYADSDVHHSSSLAFGEVCCTDVTSRIKPTGFAPVARGLG